MSRTAIYVEDSFDSAHWLPEVPKSHKCHAMHGHTYRIRLYVEGKVDPKTGWIYDYTELKRFWKPVKFALDHHTLNDIIPNPTCELIAEYIGGELPMVSRIDLGETVNCGVVWERK